MARSAEFESGSRPLRWEDMSAQEQRVSQGLISQQSENIGARMTAKAATTKGSEKRKFENAATHPDLVEQPQTLEQATDRLITGMHQAAQPEFTAPGEHLAGGEFYYKHGGAIRTAAQVAGRDEDVAITASSQMSPRTTPTAERRTIVALGQAHGRGRRGAEVRHDRGDPLLLLARAGDGADGHRRPERRLLPRHHLVRDAT